MLRRKRFPRILARGWRGLSALTQRRHAAATCAVGIAPVLAVFLYTLRSNPTWLGFYFVIGIMAASAVLLAYWHSRFLYFVLLCLVAAAGAMFVFAASSVYAPFPIRLSAHLTGIHALEASTYSDERLPADTQPGIVMEWPADVLYVGGEVMLQPAVLSADQERIRGLWRLGSDAELEAVTYEAADGSPQIRIDVARDGPDEPTAATIWASESGVLLDPDSAKHDEAWSPGSGECPTIVLQGWSYLIPLGATWCTLDGATGTPVEAVHVALPMSGPAEVVAASPLPANLAWRAQLFSATTSACLLGVRLTSSFVLAVARSGSLEYADGAKVMLDELFAVVLKGDGIIASFSSRELLWVNRGNDQRVPEALRLTCQPRSPHGISWLSLRLSGIGGSLQVGAADSMAFGNAGIEFTTREPFALHQGLASSQEFLFTQACERIYVDGEPRALPCLWSRMGPSYRALAVSALLGVTATLLVAAISDMRQRFSK
jgi:hypothetical protein